MHLFMLLTWLIILTIFLRTKRSEDYVNKNWVLCSGIIVKVTIHYPGAADEYTITTIRYKLNNRVFEFNHQSGSSGSVNGKVGDSVELLYNLNNIKKIVVKPARDLMFYVVFPLISIFVLSLSYFLWEPITFGQFIFWLIPTFLICARLFVGDFASIKLFLQPVRNTIENEPENAVEVLS